MAKSKTKFLIPVLIFIFLLTTFLGTGCFRKKESEAIKEEKIELTYYKLFDDEDVFAPLIQQYQSTHRNIKINYRKFTDPEEYLNLIINELAEGEGPDIFSIHNTWLPKQYKKLSPLPGGNEAVENFKNIFVSVAAEDLIFADETGTEKIYALPLSVDTLALYYNQDHFEDKIPSRGKPGATWEEIKEDVYKLNKEDNSFERFEMAGIALGREDNILRATDILYLLFLQHKVDFYNEDYTEATFAVQQGFDVLGQSQYPGRDALELFTSFALPANKNYSWNPYLADASSEEKEILTFVKGKVSMIFGYSYLYQTILDQIEIQKAKGVKTIDPSTVKIAEVPQIYDPKTTTEKRDAYASYFAETVSRTSKHAKEAWEFLQFLISKENLQYYHEKTHKPTSRRDMIEEQSKDPIYGVFAKQIGYTESLPMADSEKYEEIFEEAISAVIATSKVGDALKTAQSKINDLIPKEGIYPEATDQKESDQKE